MFLTKEIDYAVRVIRALSAGDRKTVEFVSTKEHMPHQYAYKILKKLEKMGLVQSVRGREGGYYLAKPLEDLTLLEIAAAIGKPLVLNQCLREGEPGACPNKGAHPQCTVHLELGRIQDVLVMELQKKSMLEILSAKDILSDHPDEAELLPALAQEA